MALKVAVKSVAGHAEIPNMKGVSRRPRTVRADKPCSVCGKPIHYTYSGPVEGVCGRCTDKRRRGGGSVRPYHRGMVIGRAPKRRSKAAIAVFVTIVIVGGAVAVAAALGLLFG